MLRRVRPNSSLLIHQRRIEPLSISRGLPCIYIDIVCLVFVTFFLILRMLALTPMMFALILMMLSLILLESCSDSQGCRLLRFHQPLFVSPQAYFPAMSAWLVLILPSRSGRQDAEYKIGGRAISKYKKNSTQYKKHPRTGLQDWPLNAISASVFRISAIGQ